MHQVFSYCQAAHCSVTSVALLRLGPTLATRPDLFPTRSFLWFSWTQLHHKLSSKMKTDLCPNARAEPRRNCDVNRESGTESANRRWLQRYCSAIRSFRPGVCHPRQSGWQNVTLQHIQRLIHQNVVIQTGKHRNHLLIRENENELPRSTSGTVESDVSGSHLQ